MSNQSEWTVGKYLIYRLQEAGVRHLFGIPGDYIVDFVLAANKAGIKHVGNTNEINAGYAADGYARLNGISAVAVTYGVGGLSLLNTIAGAYVERVPVIAINGAPSIAKHLEDRDTGLLWHHMINVQSSDLEMYRRVTVAAEQLKNPVMAPRQIDQAIITCLTESRPIYFETFEDIYTQPCAAPEGNLKASPVVPRQATALQAAVRAAADKIKRSQHPILWGGVEVQRYRLQDSFESLINSTGLPYATSLLGKSLLSEDNPAYVGVYEGQSSSAGVLPIIQNSDCLIGLGVLTTDINLLGTKGVTGDDLTGRVPWGDDFILAVNDAVRVGTNYFSQVALGDFIDALGEELGDYKAPSLDPPRANAAGASYTEATADTKLTFDNFFGRINAFVDDTMIVLADIGFSSFGAMNFKIHRRSGFICQAAYASIGYAVGATLGVKCAKPEVRPITFTGDGSFHMTCQTIATMVKEGQNPIIFVMNNGIFGIEQWLVDASVFASGDPAKVAPTNVLHRWAYSKLTEVFGGRGWAVETLGDLDKALSEIRDAPGTLALVDVRVEELSYPEDLAWRVKS